MKRTAMLRRTPLSSTSRVEPGKAKERTCDGPNCEETFVQRRMEHRFCSPACMLRGRAAEKKAADAAAKVKKQDRDTIPALIARADRAFSLFIRTRDRLNGETCISSGKPLDWSGNKTDAGHYRSRGAASHLRYDPRNCHAQTKYENRHRAGNAVEYRIRLIQRIGLAEVEALEANNTPHKWTKDELRSIAADFRKQARDLLKARTA